MLPVRCGGAAAVSTATGRPAAFDQNEGPAGVERISGLCAIWPHII